MGANKIIQTIELVKKRKEITLKALAYRLSLPRKEVREIAEMLEAEQLVTSEECSDGDIIIRINR